MNTQVFIKKRVIVISVLLAAVFIGLLGCRQAPPRVYKILQPQNATESRSVPYNLQEGPYNQQNQVEEKNKYFLSSEPFQSDTDLIPVPDQSGSKLYHLGTGDILRVQVYQLVDLERDTLLMVEVDREGQIYMPLLNHVKVAGKTVEQVHDYLVHRLGQEFIQDPKVEVSIEKYRSKVVMVLGQVRRPGSVLLETDSTTLLDVIAQAGGLGNDVAPTIEILRGAYNGSLAGGEQKLTGTSSSGSQKVPVALLFAEEGHGRVNPLIYPGDVVKVSPSREGFVYMAGEVERPGAKTFCRPMTILQAVTSAGGATKVAADDKCKIIRRNVDGSEKEITVDLDKIRSGKEENLLLAQNDTVIVPLHPVKKFFEDINQMFRRGMNAGVSVTYDAAQDIGIPSSGYGMASGL